MGHRPCETCGSVVRDVDSTGEPGCCDKCTTPSIDEARPLVTRLRDLMQSGMTDDERAVVLRLVSDGYHHCGALDVYCQCDNDE